MNASLLCAVTAAVLLASSMYRVAVLYRRSFIATLGGRLTRSFVLTNPRSLFLVSAACAVLGATCGYATLGPVAAVTAASLSLSSPWILVRSLASRRRKRFAYQLPDGLLALASALRAGCTLSRGLELMAGRQPSPLNQEFTIVLAEYRVGRPLAESLEEMHRRVDAPELQLLNTAINVSRRVGGNLADTLESLARTLQEKAHVEAKIDALTSMGRAQGWVVGLLPIFIGLVLYQQQPERMSLLFTQWYGWIVLGVVAAMMTLAAGMIRKIVSIDV